MPTGSRRSYFQKRSRGNANGQKAETTCQQAERRGNTNRQKGYTMPTGSKERQCSKAEYEEKLIISAMQRAVSIHVGKKFLRMKEFADGKPDEVLERLWQTWSLLGRSGP